MQKHKFASVKKLLPDTKMVPVLTDVFLMEAYVNEKMMGTNPDSLTIIKQSFYAAILKHHHVDSTAFYTTFNYFQSRPKEYADLLNLVDSGMTKIKPLDTTFVNPVVNSTPTPANIDILPNFNEQEKAMGKEYLKKQSALQKLKFKKPPINK